MRILIITLVLNVGVYGMVEFAKVLRANVVLEKPSCTIDRDDLLVTFMGTESRPMTRKSCERMEGQFNPVQS